MYTYELEKIADILDELVPLVQEHHEEVDTDKERVQMNPDYDTYLALEEAGAVVLHTVRDNGILAGYSVVLVHPHLHYKDNVYGQNDLLYVCPEYRSEGLAKGLLETQEEHLKELGVTVMTMHMKEDRRFEHLMQNLGYHHSEIIYKKYIGE